MTRHGNTNPIEHLSDIARITHPDWTAAFFQNLRTVKVPEIFRLLLPMACWVDLQAMA